MKARSTGSGGYRVAYYPDDDLMYNDDDMDYIPPARKKTAPLSGGGKERPGLPKRPAAQSPPPGAGGQSTSPSKAVRSRPTNNQLLYKAYFRWAHYPHKLKAANLPDETDACASVTAAFLQVLQIMQTAEQLRHGNNKRNVLQILSSNTRRTKVVELSSGTHRVPDELKKHYLSDGEGGQYSTNLDRNRYGNDDNYLFTVIRYDLEFLGLCPCMVDVEIIDAKQGNTSIIVSAGTEVCTCQGGPPVGAAPVGAPAPVASGATAGGHHHHHATSGGAGHLNHHVGPAATVSGGGRPAVKTEYADPLGPHAHMPPAAGGAAGGNSGYAGGGAAAAAAAAGGGPPDVANLPPLYGPGSFRGGPALGGAMGRESPKRSGTSVSQLFDALVMAATGGADGAADGAAGGGGLGGEPPVTSPAHADRPERGLGGGGVGAMGALGGPRLHGPPGRNKSKLWSINNLSYGGEVDSLQNALDAFREQDEIASGDPAAFLTGGASAGGVGPDGSLQRSDSLRQRRRKPLRNSSILGRPASSGGVAPLGSKLGIVLREKSDDNLKLTTDPDLGGALAVGGLGGCGVSFQAGGGLPLPLGGHGGAPQPGSSLASGEDDNDGGGEADAEDALAAKGEDLGVEGEGEAGGEEEGQEEGAGGGGMGAGRGGFGGGGPTASGTLARASALPRSGAPLRHHVRHVPRQSSVANLGPRVANSSGGGGGNGGGGANVGGGGGPGASGMGALGGLGLGMLGPGGLGGSASAAIAGEQLRRLANELEVMRHENRSLKQQLQRVNSSSANGAGGGGGGGGAGSPSLGLKQQQQQSSDNLAANDSARLRKLEAELSSMRNELLGLSSAKKSADDENKHLKRELLTAQQQLAALLSRVMGGCGGAPGALGLGAAAAPPLQGSPTAGILASLLGPTGGASTGPAPPPPQQQQQQPLVAGAFDPSTFAAHLVAVRQQAGPLQQNPVSGGGGAHEVAAAAHEGRGSAAFPGGSDAAEVLLAAVAAAGATGGSGGGRHSEPGDGAQHGFDVGAQPQGLGKKRTADEAGLPMAVGDGEVDGVGAAADIESLSRRACAAAPPPTSAVPDLMGAASKPGPSHQQQQEHPQLASLPSFGPAVPGAATAATSLNAFQRAADSGAAGTPADSNCFSDVVQLLALPNLDCAFTSSELAAPFGGGGGGTAALAAASGVQALGSGSGSGSGTASVPQMPQSEHQQLLMSGQYGQQQQQHHHHHHHGLR
ncbi:hypothetical protein PLESTB_000621700 [Pleodorina starrii]|uniref:Uncharacterized protein n=1 Tax=Pleodorina starrii TaxID=330485 RepID=A0A9W6BHS1_9CHLO|nr:hypothetical protein PLESTM_001731100 [Pleodorina starrii]GLC52369.1 hypothetical protein PLESTB_000621700 [Pleodorina starrii]GLC67963.1 hypothetical protein PLESTF_000628600 [Pleodorina starrii]